MQCSFYMVVIKSTSHAYYVSVQSVANTMVKVLATWTKCSDCSTELITFNILCYITAPYYGKVYLLVSIC